MANIIRKVREIDSSDRHALEHVIGQRLAENQQLVIQVVSIDMTPTESKGGDDELPAWCNIYEGLTDAEVDELDAAIRQRANITRTFE